VIAIAGPAGGGSISYQQAFQGQARTRTSIMVERRKELDRRYHRKNKMAKLKAKLAHAKDSRERESLLRKIHILSPWWEEPKPEKV
jgi:hypothetical protein